MHLKRVTANEKSSRRARKIIRVVLIALFTFTKNKAYSEFFSYEAQRYSYKQKSRNRKDFEAPDKNHMSRTTSTVNVVF